jgi:proton-translocating NADH-quinone oxidoreductase chain N
VIGSWWVIAPLACLAGGALAICLAARWFPRRLLPVRNAWLAAVTALVFALALAAWVPMAALVRAAGGGAWERLPVWGTAGAHGVRLRADPGAVVVIGTALALGLLVSIYSGRYLALDKRYETYYPLLLLLAAGLTGMVLAADLFNLYLFCELMSITAYVLVALRRRTDTAIEAGFKYLIMGSTGTIVLLLGISFVYRETGRLELPIVLDGRPGPWTRAGLACALVGLGIKSAIVPLHTWLPDAHGRAPSSISAMLSGIVIQSTFYTMLKVSLGLGIGGQRLGALLLALSALNMVVGNSMALVQTHTKRMLAYSSLAQMGYMMFGIGVGLTSRSAAAVQAGFFYLVAHAAIKGLAFLCKGVCHFYCHTTLVSQLRGTARQLPLVAVSMSVALGGLAAVPPLAGFAGKWFVLVSAARVATPAAWAGIAVMALNSVLALGYYLPLIAALYAAPEPGAGSERIAVSPWMAVPLLALSGLAIAIGIYPGPWMDSMGSVGAYLLSWGS